MTNKFLPRVLQSRPGVMRKVRPVPTLAERWGKVFVAMTLLVWCLGVVAGFRFSLTILTFAGFLALVAGFRWPVIGLFGIGMLCTMDAVTRSLLLSGGFLRWNTLNYLLLLFMLFHFPLLLKLRGSIIRLLQVFICVLVLGLLITPSPSEGFEHLLNIVTCFGLIIVFVLSASDSQVWFWMPLTNGVLAAMGGFVFFLQQSNLPIVNYNAWALFPLAGLFSIAMAFAFPLTQGRQFGLGVLALVNFLWAFLSGSRGGLLLAVACLLFIILMFRGVSQRLLYAVTGLSLAVVILSLFTNLDENALHRLDKLFDTGQSIRSRTSGRSELALGGWYIFLEHPLGVGTGGYSIAWSKLGFVEGLTTEFSYGEQRAAHSGWIKTLAENGIPGIVLLAAYVGSFTVVGWWRKKKRGNLLIGLLVTCIITIALLSTEFQSKGLWFLVSGGTVLLYLRSDGHREVRKRERAHSRRPQVVPAGGPHV